jgi:putative drug exporter of the RND superfamily
MFFRLLGRFASAAWPVLLPGWIALLLLTRWAAPPWHEVAQDQEFAFLPADAPSRRAQEMFEKAFPDDRSTSDVVLVLQRKDEDKSTRAIDLRFIEGTILPGLRKIADSEGGLAAEPVASDEPLFSTDPAPAASAHKSILARIRTPNSPAGGAFLVSPDRKLMLVVVELTTEFLSDANWPVITKIEGMVNDLRTHDKVPTGLEILVTGSAVIGRDHATAQLESVRATQLLTVVLVIGLLVAIYRAPLLAIIPLITVYMAVEISVNSLAILARAGHIQLFAGIEIYITILAYGAGVDYCLFLTARYKEELDRGLDPAQAVADAVRDVGPALAASAAAVICGIGMMYFARFGKFREAGLAIPFSLVIVLCATLTFSPSLLRLAGRWAFWPQRMKIQAGSPATNNSTADKEAPLEKGILEGIWDRVGQRLLQRPGTIWLGTVILMAPFAIFAGYSYHRLSYDLIGVLPAKAPSVMGTHALQEHFPAGVMGPTTLLLVDPSVDFSSPRGRDVVGRVTNAIVEHSEELGLADVRSLTAPMGITPASKESPFAGMNIPEATIHEATERGALDHYVTDLGERAKVGTRLELILTPSPFSVRSIEDLTRIQSIVQGALPEEVRGDASLYMAGITPSVRDLASVIREDRSRIQILVLASVFVILCLLLRRVVVPVYLLLSVLFSYFTALGVAFAVFWMLDPAGFIGIDWKVAIFLFTILIAVGADYNIFLMTRIQEEEARHGPVLAITHALDRTGPVISSCGIIMAGTFSSLLAGSLSDMKQLGFALAFGVLLDTFVVRPVLVPAFLILWRSSKWSRTRHKPSNTAAMVPSTELHRPAPLP